MTNIGGLVSSRSVRLLDKLESMSEESDTRDKLWLELRKEVRTHMKTLGCTAVIGYRYATKFALKFELYGVELHVQRSTIKPKTNKT